MKQIILIILSFILITNSKSQTNNGSQSPSIGGVGEAVDSAIMYLTGTFKKYNPQRAFQINLQNATNGNAKAMNAVALQYMKGLGVDSNFNLAVYWFNQAATNNYTRALVNLGMLYKHKASDSLGYSIACNYFNQALQVNEPSAFFAQGYMFYKGLGCTQSYTAALQLFNQGISINQSNCMYFKGLCYKFGYGVATNADSANYYIDTAAKLGYKQANAELYNNNQTSTAARKSTTKNVNKEEQVTKNGLTDFQSNGQTDFQPIAKTNKSTVINGQYVGVLNQYDYSGKKLMAQIPITLQVSTANNIINGSLQLNNSQSVQLKAIQQGNQLIFSQTAFATSSSLRSLRETKLVFKTATFNISHSFGGVGEADTNFLTGTLQLFNTYTHETYKPINIKLSQQKTTEQLTNKSIDKLPISVFPNPTKGTFTISFSLAKPSPVKINIYNQQGLNVYAKVFESLPQGKNQILLNPSLEGREAGIYIVKISSNQQQQTTAFIKE